MNAKKKKLKSAPSVPKTPVSSISPAEQIVGAVFLGKVAEYFSQLGVIALTLEAPLAVGETIRIKGHTTDLTQKVDHLEVDRHSVQGASAGESVGVKIADKCRVGDAVYKI